MDSIDRVRVVGKRMSMWIIIIEISTEAHPTMMCACACVYVALSTYDHDEAAHCVCAASDRCCDSTQSVCQEKTYSHISPDIFTIVFYQIISRCLRLRVRIMTSLQLN